MNRDKTGRFVKTSLCDRFWLKVEKTEDGCWLWKGTRNVQGYGKISQGGQHKGAHRIAWELTFGPIPEGMNVLHHCDNPPCVNPTHLFLGTDSENTNDCISKGRFNPPKGEAQWRAKLTVDQVREIRKSGLGYKKLGKLYGVTPSCIQSVRKNKTWRFV